MGLSVGGSFTGLTVRRKLVEADAPLPSVTVSVMAVVPDRLAAGVRVTVRLPPLPPRTTPASGRSAWLEELRVTVRLAAGVSGSLTVKFNVMEESSLMV